MLRLTEQLILFSGSWDRWLAAQMSLFATWCFQILCSWEKAQINDHNMHAELINWINRTVLSFRKLKTWAVGHDFCAITVCLFVFFHSFFGSGRSAGTSPCLDPVSHIVAFKCSGCLNPCYFSWIAFSFGSALLQRVTVLYKGCWVWFSFTFWQQAPFHPLDGPSTLLECFVSAKDRSRR